MDSENQQEFAYLQVFLLAAKASMAACTTHMQHHDTHVDRVEISPIETERSR